MDSWIVKVLIGVLATLFGLGGLIGGQVLFGLAGLVVGLAFLFGGLQDRPYRGR